MARTITHVWHNRGLCDTGQASSYGRRSASTSSIDPCVARAPYSRATPMANNARATASRCRRAASQPSSRPSFRPSSQPSFRPSSQPSFHFSTRALSICDQKSRSPLFSRPHSVRESLGPASEPPTRPWPGAANDLTARIRLLGPQTLHEVQLASVGRQSPAPILSQVNCSVRADGGTPSQTAAGRHGCPAVAKPVPAPPARP